MRELRKTKQNKPKTEDTQKNQPGPGESKQNPSHKDGGSRVDPPQQSGAPSLNDSVDYLETSLSHEQIQSYRNAAEGLTQPNTTLDSLTGPRIPAAPRKQDGRGAQYGLRKS